VRATSTEEEKTMGTVAQTRRLYRSRTDRKLAGVCGGLAQYFNTDATLLRVLFVVLALLGGPGLVIYLLMWILVPEEPLGAA
jgi:phage shock protein PspC (stress-responsive transcriptional regulator)